MNGQKNKHTKYFISLGKIYAVNQVLLWLLQPHRGDFQTSQGSFLPWSCCTWWLDFQWLQVQRPGQDFWHEFCCLWNRGFFGGKCGIYGSTGGHVGVYEHIRGVYGLSCIFVECAMVCMFDQPKARCLPIKSAVDALTSINYNQRYKKMIF